ncbi:MAG: DNA primase, partial [Lachnospiraceae bacterium]|nr:DNA primase [Lachnospiraceae bacterium]
RKLCGFAQDVERENYIEAIAEKYHIGFENLRKLVLSQAARTGFASELQRPKSGIHKKNTAADAAKKNQRALLTWFADRPDVYKQAQSYISASDFTDELYRQIAEKLFEGIGSGQVNPASIINMFEDAEQQNQAALVFQTRIEQLETKAEQEKALHDLIVAVKSQSYEYYTGQMGTDVGALDEVIKGKKALEELKNVHIVL